MRTKRNTGGTAGVIAPDEHGRRLRLVSEAAAVQQYEGLEPPEQEFVDWLVEIFFGSEYNVDKDARSKQSVTELYRRFRGAYIDPATYSTYSRKFDDYDSARVSFGSIVSDVQKFRAADNLPENSETYAFLRDEAFTRFSQLASVFPVSNDAADRIKWLIDSFIRRQFGIGESQKPGYTPAHGETMGDEKNTEDELVTLARKVPSEKRGPAINLLKTLVEAGSETTTRAKEPPRRDWIEAHKRGEEVPDFIKRVFDPELRDGTMHKGLFSRYENLRRDFYGYQRHNELPGWLKAVPTQEEWNDRQVAEGKVKPVSPPVPEEIREYQRDLKRVGAARRRGVAVPVM